MKYWIVILFFCLTACNSQRFYIVRHAEKAVVSKDSMAMMANDLPLSEAGKLRAFKLRDELRTENIQHIFSTNTIRTIATAQPLSDMGNIPVSLYSSSKDSLDAFVTQLKSIREGNVLVIGHSNTVDDLVNRLTGQTVLPTDLKDAEYDNLFIVTRSNSRMVFKRRKYGNPSNTEKN